MSKQSKDYLDEVELGKLEFEYATAMDILCTEAYVHVSNFERQNGGARAVEHTNRRLKKLDSAIKKLEKKGNIISAKEIEQNLCDMVGVRLVCPFIDDVYDVVEAIKQSNFLEICEEKDYIKNPKESGYRSYHIIVKIPVKVGDETKMVKGEIQVRTLAMDAWAAMEHRIKYKPKGSRELTDRQKEMLINCAKAFCAIEEYMRNLLPKDRYSVENSKKPLNLSEYDFTDDDFFEYRSALMILKTHLRARTDSYDLIKGAKTVEHLNARIKKIPSIYRKLSEKNLDMSMDTIRDNISDVAAIRLVCPFIDDVYELVDLIKESDLIQVYEERDYVKNPKQSGYRSYHLLAYVPTPVGDDVKMVKTEIQIRTLAMDAWAAMEDRIKYNQDYVFTDEQKMMLKICANTFQEVEDYMSNLLNPNSKHIRSHLDEYYDSNVSGIKKFVKNKES